jgi:acetyl esterase/lipase
VAEQVTLPPGVELLEDVEFGSGGGRALRMHILRPLDPTQRPMPVIVFVHGGWWRAGDRSSGIANLAPLAEQGYFCASLEYRLSGEAQWPAQIEDCKCGIRYLRAHSDLWGIDPDRIGVWGRSAGGHLVAMLGSTASVTELEGTGGWTEQSSAVQAVCDWFGMSDLTLLGHDAPDSASALLLGGPVKDHLDAASRASPITYVSPTTAPHLIMHGTADAVVPSSQSDLLHEMLQNAGVESTLHLFDGLGHEHLGDEAVGELQAFFDRHLRINES